MRTPPHSKLGFLAAPSTGTRSIDAPRVRVVESGDNCGFLRPSRPRWSIDDERPGPCSEKWSGWEQTHALGAGRARDLDRIFGTRMSAMRLGRVLLGRELRVVDDQISAFAQPHDPIAHGAQLGGVFRLERIAGLGRLTDVLLFDE